MAPRFSRPIHGLPTIHSEWASAHPCRIWPVIIDRRVPCNVLVEQLPCALASKLEKLRRLRLISASNVRMSELIIVLGEPHRPALTNASVLPPARIQGWLTA